jgi:hypothetical protein
MPILEAAVQLVDEAETPLRGTEDGQGAPVLLGAATSGLVGEGTSSCWSIPLRACRYARTRDSAADGRHYRPRKAADQLATAQYCVVEVRGEHEELSLTIFHSATLGTTGLLRGLVRYGIALALRARRASITARTCFKAS